MPKSRIERACEHCAQPFTTARGGQRFCSRKCGIRHWQIAHPTDRPHLSAGLCAWCGGSFDQERINQKYCTPSCTALADSERKAKRHENGPGKGWSKGVEYVKRRVCELCGSKFYCPPVLARRGGGKFCSNDCRVRNLATNPENFPRGRNRRGKGGKRDDLGGLYLRSSWEANWARYLNERVAAGAIVRWEYEAETFEFPIRRGSKFYTPDFRVETLSGTVEFHEIKGYMDPISKTKLRRMAKYFPDVRVLVIDKAVYYEMAERYSSVLPGWEDDGRIKKHKGGN